MNISFLVPNSMDHLGPGFLAFYKGIAPRLMKISIGQAITFTAYEAPGGGDGWGRWWWCGFLGEASDDGEIWRMIFFIDLQCYTI